MKKQYQSFLSNIKPLKAPAGIYSKIMKAINDEFEFVPIVGSVSCGKPLYATENIEGRVPVSRSKLKPHFNYFILRASGDSMNKKNINDGDLILARQQKNADNGDIVVALVDGNEATVKEIWIEEKNIELRPHSTNKKHKSIYINTELEIQGKVLDKINNH